MIRFFRVAASTALILGILSLVAAVLAAQTASQPSSASSARIGESGGRPESGTAQYTLSYERYHKAVAYSRAAYILYFVNAFVAIAAAWLLLHLGIAARFRDIAENAGERRWIQGAVFSTLVVWTVQLCELPVRVYGHALSLRYEQSIQGWGSWLWDWTKSQLLLTAFAIVIVLLLHLVMRRSPRRWWFYSWLASLPIAVALVFGAPLVVDPLFHDFTSLAVKYPQLSASIQKLTQRAGVPIPENRIFLMDASAKTNAINAYVTGLGASKRVVIWDTTIAKLPPEETLFIVAHELGHYVLGHVVKGILFSAALMLVALYLLFRGLHFALDRSAADWKIYGANDWAALAVLLLLGLVLSFLGEPLANGFSREVEHQADAYGLELIHGLVPNSEEVAARSFQHLGELDLSDPNPPAFITFWLYTHPPLADRLVFAHSYDPWSKGAQPRYVKQ